MSDKVSFVPMTGEPTFTLLARDPQFKPLIDQWVALREAAIRCGDRPSADLVQLESARKIAADGADWRLKNNGAWHALPSTIEMLGTVTPHPAMPVPSVLKAPQPAPPPTAPALVYSAIRGAAAGVGVSLPTMLSFALIESGFNPKAVAPGSSAIGLYQFTHATWTEMVGTYGPRHNVTEDMIYDASANALMMAERLKLYADHLSIQRVPADAGNMYCLHFLGMLGGTRLVLAASTTTSQWSADLIASKVYPVAAAANPVIFAQCTLKQLYDKLYSKAQQLAISYAGMYHITEATV